MSDVKKKRLYEEQIVKQMLMVAVIDAIDAGIEIEDVSRFIKDEFDNILKKILTH